MRKILATPLTFALMLGACGGTQNPGMESVHQPVVNRTDYAIDLQSGSQGGLASGEAQRLSGWFQSLKIGYGDRVSIDDPSPHRGGESHEAVAAIAARYGLLLDEGAPVTTGQVTPGSIRVVVSRMAASVPGCPDWSRPSQPEFKGSTMSNYGCAINSNLAAMIANPEDLIQGQTGTGGPDARTVSKAIQSFREKAPTGAGALKNESSKGN